MTHAGLTEQEITALPDQTRVYESVGRMFILSNKYVIKLELFVAIFSKFNFSHSTTVGAGILNAFCFPMVFRFPMHRWLA